MGTQIRMPKLGDDIEEAAIVAWLKRSGDQVRNGEIIAEIETEKANVELEAEGEGALQILVEAGRRVAIGTPIATIGEVSEPVVTSTAAPPEPLISEPDAAPVHAERAIGEREAIEPRGRTRS